MREATIPSPLADHLQYPMPAQPRKTLGNKSEQTTKPKPPSHSRCLHLQGVIHYLNACIDLDDILILAQRVCKGEALLGHSVESQVVIVLG